MIDKICTNITLSIVFQSALKKLYSFVTGHIFETKVAGHFIAAMVRTFSKVCSACYMAEYSIRLSLSPFRSCVHYIILLSCEGRHGYGMADEEIHVKFW